MDIGPDLKALRRRYGLSQRELARRAGVTNATISMIERGQTSPSIGSLKKILDSLSVSLSEFFAGEPAADPKIFFERDELVELGSGPISFRQIGGNLKGKALQVLHEVYQPRADTGRSMYQHRGEEAGLVVRGRVEVTVGGQRRVLAAGDAYYFDSRLPHRFRNVGAEPCEIVSVCTPPTF